jgi:uncharacterized protein HemX
MDANESEPRTPEETDPLRAYALQNATKEVKPKSSTAPFLVSVVVTAAILAIAFYLWGR